MYDAVEALGKGKLAKGNWQWQKSWQGARGSWQS